MFFWWIGVWEHWLSDDWAWPWSTRTVNLRSVLHAHPWLTQCSAVLCTISNCLFLSSFLCWARLLENSLNMCLLVCVRYKESHVVTARAAVTVIHPELGCLISSTQLQNDSIILLYAEHGSSPGYVWLLVTVKLWGGHSKKCGSDCSVAWQMVELSGAKSPPVPTVCGCAQWEREAAHCGRKYAGLSCYPATGSKESH